MTNEYSFPLVKGKAGMGVAGEAVNPQISTPTLALPLTGGGDKRY